MARVIRKLTKGRKSKPSRPANRGKNGLNKGNTIKKTISPSRIRNSPMGFPPKNALFP
jgi:hypothetical protein